MAAAPRLRCWLCVERLDGNNPLAPKDETAAKPIPVRRKRRGVDHDALAPNCIENEDWRNRCPPCATCDRGGDTCTARFGRGEDTKYSVATCQLCRNDGGVAARNARFAEAGRVEDARRAETDAIPSVRRVGSRANWEDWNAVGDDGLSLIDKLGDAACDLGMECEALGQAFPIGKERDLELARRVWKGLPDAALERKAILVQPYIGTILDLAQEQKIHVRNPKPRDYLPDLERLAKDWSDDEAELSDRFHGMPAFVWYCMLPLFVATLCTSLACYALAERFVKWYSRSQAQGKGGIFRMIFRRRSHGARAAPLYLLEVVLRELGLKPYVGPRLAMITYRGCVLGLIYALFGTSFSLVSVVGRVILLAGCVFGEKKQLAAILGCTPRKAPSERSIGYDLIGRPSREQTRAISYAMTCVTPGPGPRVVVHVQRCPDALAPRIDPRGRNHGLGENERLFYVFGKTNTELKENGERVLGYEITTWLDGYADMEAGRKRWCTLKDPGECNNAMRGNSFSVALNNDQGRYVPRGAYGGRQREDGFVVDIGRQLNNHPLTLAVLERANPINEASLRNQPYDVSLFGGPENYCEELPPRGRHGRLEALTERTRLQALGGHTFAAQNLYSRYAKPPLLVAIGSVDKDAIKAAIDRGDADAVVALLTPVADAITLGIKRIGDALDAGRKEGKDWRAVANKAGDELRVICEPRLAILPPTTAIVPRAVALATLEENAMQDAGWLAPEGRPVPLAGFAASAPRRRSYAEAVAGPPRRAAVGPPPRPAAVGPGSGSPRPKVKPRRWSFGSAEKEDAAASSMFTGLDIEDMCEDDNITY